MDWSLLACGARGHVTYAPDEPAIRSRLSTPTPGGTAWRCLRCGTFVPGDPDGSGPAAAAPRVRRGKELRSALILRAFAVERFARAIVLVVLAYALWRFKYSRLSIEKEYNQDLLPVLRSLLTEFGYNVHHSRLLGLIQHAFALNARTITWLALGALAYAALEILESVALWLLRRWGEYFAMIATSAGIPYEIYDLTAKITVLRVVAFLINVALVVYLVVTKRLFGVRGGKRAYEARLRSESILDPGDAHHPPAAAEPDRGAAGTDGPESLAEPAAADPHPPATPGPPDPATPGPAHPPPPATPGSSDLPERAATGAGRPSPAPDSPTSPE